MARAQTQRSRSFSRMIAGRRLRSYGALRVKKSQPGYKHLAPLGRSDMLRSSSRLFEMLPAAGLEFPGL